MIVHVWINAVSHPHHTHCVVLSIETEICSIYKQATSDGSRYHGSGAERLRETKVVAHTQNSQLYLFIYYLSIYFK
jgi:hypothetical protein